MRRFKTFKNWYRSIFQPRKLPIKQDWMRLEAGDIAGCKVPLLVHYEYHRYFWKASKGKEVAHVMTHIILN